jgi:hypothetical protein
LILAECYARNGDIQNANRFLEELLSKRYLEGNFVFNSSYHISLLDRVISERRKELVFRGIRWSDLRRLNKEADFKQELTRVVDGKTYTLLPNDKKYILPIPDLVIKISGMQQNER